MALHSLQRVQDLPISLDTAWDFFSAPDNLDAITPPDLSFEILSGGGVRMYEGMIIAYRISVLPGIHHQWVTEITTVRDRQYFIDEQRFGPYKFWHHQHHFEEIPGGVRMTDILHYDVGKWWIGDLAHAFFVRDKVQSIFTFRHKELERRFGRLE
ncbi:MAG: SRPBCC family protein [Verrucomicrobiota bacterium JB022]|nr:SRPBCC family protein [Verrucomicrobiota bacterium JB022]